MEIIFLKEIQRVIAQLQHVPQPAEFYFKTLLAEN